MGEIRFLHCGDCAVTVEFGNAIDAAMNQSVHRFAKAVESLGHPGVLEVVPTYRSATVHYDPLVLPHSQLLKLLEPLAQLDTTQSAPSEIIEIPVLYGGEMGPDLQEVADHCGLTPQEVIALHSAPVYGIFMLGFTPGFPYLGGMDAQLTTPRRAEPRVCIPAGSVGIAGAQTGVYPIQSPGGWQLIGRTPLRLFDPSRSQPILLQAGQGIRFVPIDQGEFDRIEGGQAQ